ncbi:hypothetical protein F4861DRAFT_34670 [Xylaria intraflava]|nr:hypothetical protein F4861DRAFT_34670 [Xylaria intraflava]
MLGSRRENTYFSHAKWKGWVMLPCWAVQIIILLSLMGLFAYRLSRTITTWEEEDNKGNLPVVEFVWEIANVAFSLISLLIILVAIARYIAEILTPLPMLFGCVLNLVFSSVVLALDIVIYVRRQDKKYSIIGLVLDVVLILFTVIPLIYAVVLYRRLLQYDDYHVPGTHKIFGFGAMGEDPEDRLLVRQSAQIPSNHVNAIPGATAVASGEAQRRSRSVSLDSPRMSLSLSGYATPTSQPSSPLDPTHEPRRSYDHKRDTMFDAYVARRRSQNRQPENRLSQDDVRRALGDEFGFSDLLSPGDSGSKINSKGEIINSGTVHAGYSSQPRMSSIGRKASHEGVISGGNVMNNHGSVRRITTPPREPLHRGRSLNSVPEAHEEEDNHRGESAPSGSQQRSLSHGDVEGRNGRGSPVQMDRVEGFEDVELEARKRREAL